MANDFRDLRTWQLAVSLEEIAQALLSRPAVTRDLVFKDELIRAASSGPRNIAEGFGRYKHKEFAYFVRIAKGSENEVLNQFEYALRKDYLSEQEFHAYERAARRAIRAVSGLIRYLESTPDPE